MANQNEIAAHYFSVTKITWADTWSDFGQPCDIDLCVMK